MEAQNIMAESLNNLVEFTITVPLSEKTKNIHTNTFIYLEWDDLPDNILYLYQKVKNKIPAFRYTLYRDGYWYVKSVDIDFKEGTMQLGLSPFPTPYSVEKLTLSTQKENINKKETKTKKNVGYWIDKIATAMKNEKHAYHGGKYDCFSMSHKITCYLRKHGVTAKTIVYYSATSKSGTHRTVRYKNDSGNWVDFPYKKYGFDSLFNVTSYAKNSKEYKESC